MSDTVETPLLVVSTELNATIERARLALEGAVEHDGGADALRDCAEALHEARGVMQIVEVYGGALLAEEMEAVCLYLAAQATGTSQHDSLEVVARAMLQLPIYLERLLAGGRDIALVLLPLLNDLRAVRGKPLLSESTLLFVDVEAKREVTLADRGSDSHEDPARLAARLRPAYQLALLGWLKGQNAQTQLKKLLQVAHSMEKAADSDALYRLWWVASGVLEALSDGGLETSVSIKRLMGQADRELKRLVDQGSSNYDESPADELLNNLLYYVARADSQSKRIQEIRDAYNLSDLLMRNEQVNEVREGLAAPGMQLMETVAAAIKEDLARVKDVLDIYVRTNADDVSTLTPQIELLRKISDTLGVLGLGDLRGDVQSEIERLADIVQHEQQANESTLIEIAATLLRVEDNIDQKLMGLIRPAERSDDDELTDDEAAADAVDDLEFDAVVASVVRECLINLARIKEAITQSLAGAGDPLAFDSMRELNNGVVAALRLLEKPRVSNLLERFGALVGRTLHPGGTSMLSTHTDRLADAMVSIEYYLETVQNGRRDPFYMLDNAESCLDIVEQAETEIEHEHEQTEPALKLSADQLLAIAESNASPHDETHILAGSSTEILDPRESLDASESTEIIEVPVVAQDAEHLDPELLELFIEEAKEEIGSIRKHFPQWQDSPGAMESLITIRRSFHTLKGSGRMVGAERIGEYCWSVENLLNRLINATLHRTPPMVEFIEKSISILPQLVEQLEVGTAPEVDIDAMMQQASAFATGDPEAATMSVPKLVLDDTPAPKEEPLEMDPVLLSIFAKETDGHLSTIREYLSLCADHEPPFAVTDALYRACHTLHGGINTANVERGLEVSAALNSFVRHVYDNEGGLDKDGLTALSDSVIAMQKIVSEINQPGSARSDHSDLITRLQALAEQAAESQAVETIVPGETDLGVDLDLGVDATAANGIIDVELSGHMSTTIVGDSDTPFDEVFEAAESPQDDDRPSEPDEQRSAEESPADFDAEIAAIFSEEAGEILEVTDRALADWGSGAPSEETVSILHRQLHTLKGGARMAGLVPMGDLSHELETLLIAVEEDRVSGAGDVHEVLRHSVDQLHTMLDSVNAGRMPVATPDLIEKVHRLTAGDALDSDTAVTGDEDTGTEAVTDPSGEPSWLQSLEANLSDAGNDPEFVDSVVVAEEDLAADQLTVESDDETTPAESSEADDDAAPSGPIPAEKIAALAAGAAGIVAAKLYDVADNDVESSADAADSDSAESAEPTERRSLVRRASKERRGSRARIDSALLEQLLNAAGEVSIFQTRLNQQITSIDFNLQELDQTVNRLGGQLRNLEIETEAQIRHGHHADNPADDFDPLELDRYSKIQQLSRALAESASDVDSIKELLKSLTSEAEGLLVQQARVASELQDGLMRTRMVPFSKHVPRLTRLVRQIARETDKQAQLTVDGADGELDRQVLEKIVSPLEHMLRNAIVHGLESPQDRVSAGKPAQGSITIRLHREGSEMLIDVSDDGAGLDVEAIRRKALEQGLLDAASTTDDEHVIELIMQPGFSTAAELTQSAGRGVGMDVVANEVKKLGGSVQITTVQGHGTNFVIHLPFTLAITQALVVRAGEEVYALPLPAVEGVSRVPLPELEAMLAETEPTYQYGEQSYRFRHLAELVGTEAAANTEHADTVPLVLIKSGEHSAALLSDEMLASREVVVKSVGPQLASIRGIAGATILGDGRSVIILDPGALVRDTAPLVQIQSAAHGVEDRRPIALVVDDSITVRRVTERFLTRKGMRVMTARDGIDAIEQLQEQTPDVILLDIEMPRMDGYEFASHVRNDARFADLPIIMITSRASEKHKARAIELGVNDYLGKPYQDYQILEAINRQLEDKGLATL